MYAGWTDERVEALTKLWIEGLTASQIARIIGGMSRNAVIGKAHRIGLAGRVTRDRKRDHLGGMAKPTKDLTKVTKQARKPAPKPSPIRELIRDIPTEPLPPVDTMPAQVSFNDLEDKHCRAITVEHLPFNADRKIYCGERRVLGTSYCECHLRRYATPVFVKKTHPDRPAWQDNRTGSKGAVFMSGREKMKAY